MHCIVHSENMFFYEQHVFIKWHTFKLPRWRAALLYARRLNGDSQSRVIYISTFIRWSSW